MKRDQQLERATQLGLMVLVALMPFHAFLSVWLGHILGHESAIQGWKEVLLVLVALLAAVLLWRDPQRLRRLKQPWVALAITFGAVAALVTLVMHPPLTGVAFGVKIDFEFLVATVLTALVTTPEMTKRLTTLILIGGAIVIGVGLAQTYLLPPDFFRIFGYGPDSVVPYEHIINGVSALRFPSTLGGPNQLGTYLILPLCLSVAVAIRRRQWWWLALTAGGLIVLFGTYSRSAWLGAFAALAITIMVAMPKLWRTRAAIGVAAVVVAMLALLPVFLHNPALRYVVLHSPSSVVTAENRSSDLEHAASLDAGVTAAKQSPLGHGLGTAGPATFHSGTGNIIENYYLQLGYETGVLGAILFAALVVAMIARLTAFGLTPLLAAPTAAALVGISLVALVLPAWTDSSTALIAWTAAGAVAGLQEKAHV